MPKDSDYLLKPFVQGTSSVVVSLLLFCLAACFGQLLFELTEPEVWSQNNLTELDYYVGGALMMTPFTFSLTALSGLGLVFVLLDAFCFYQLLHTDRSRLALFFTIAGSQTGMMYSTWLIFERDNPWRFHGRVLVSICLLLVLYWFVRKVVVSIPRTMRNSG
ncbi:MAG: hypothetical protein WC661_06455 [Opitutaceae bacterium]